jgi:hypothetical protein
LSRLLRLIPRLARYALLLWGLYLLERTALHAFGGREKLWLFQKWDAHRFTSMAMLLGKLRMAGALSKVDYDHQVFDGAVYTNWGFGVPLLQIPFHAYAKVRSATHFFPDRAIYFFYFAATVPVLWAAFDRLLAMRERPGAAAPIRRNALSSAATAFVVVSALFPLMSCRFLIYEETVCYFVVVELLALAAYVFSLRTWNPVALCCLGFAAGLGLLVRPTGLPYFGVWAGLLLLERRHRTALLAFAGGAAPLVVFWAYSNWVKTGSPFGTGIANCLPWTDYHTPMLRFGSFCDDTPKHTMQVARRLLSGFFLTTGGEARPWLDRCHFGLETRPRAAEGEPFFGIATLVVLGWMFLHHLARRDRRLALYVPYACMLVIFCAYVQAGAGFAWRYSGDFWPAFVLAGVQYVRTLPQAAAPLLGVRLALVLSACSYSTLTQDIEPSLPSLETVDPTRVPKFWSDLNAALDARDPAMPSEVECGKGPNWPLHNGQGWAADCAVSTFTNVFVGVPSKQGDDYRVVFRTSGIAAEKLTIYVNGRNYEARRDGDAYSADVVIPQKRLVSPIVMATIEWVHGPDAPAGKLLSIALV